MTAEITSIDISKVMENFNFEKVQKHMQATNHFWGGTEAPTINKLRATAYQCLSTVVREKVLNCSTGGFLALCLTYPSGVKELRLIFQLESTYTTKSAKYDIEMK